MTTAKVPRSPLEKIALGCSGGGYRAASFHLGAMSYLNRLQFQGKPLLRNVKLISTVSGGSITGVVYAHQKQKGKSFEEFYHFLTDKLRSVDLVKMSIEMLNPGTVWDNTHKRKNVINAFAELYDREFTDHATFREFNVMKSHLEAVVFNATEFNYSIDFRFRNRGTGIFGNYKIRIKDDVAEEVKLADAIAASSCFTGGFEPIIWPDDFVHDASPKLSELKITSTPTGIMDGGIYDNQGIESMMNYRKSEADPYFDLIIVSDVASPYMDPFKPYQDKEKKGIRNLRLKDLIRKLAGINRRIDIVLFCLPVFFALLPFAWGYSGSIPTGISLGLLLISLAALILKIVVTARIKKRYKKLMKKLKEKVPDFYLQSLKKLKIGELSLRRIEPLVMDRLNSVVKLTSTVFLKIVRRLNYSRLYEDESYEYRRVSNLIMEMTEQDYNERLERAANKKTQGKDPAGKILHQGPYMEEIGPEIKKVAEEAAGFGTTLWFTEKDKLEDMLDKLIATGQFTMCHNMLEYIEKLMFDDANDYSTLDSKVKKDLEQLHAQCANDWHEFRKTPMFLVNEMKEKKI